MRFYNHKQGNSLLPKNFKENKKMKKGLKTTLSIIACIALSITMLAGCSAESSTSISVISREDGSGTRSAFVELLGIEEKDVNGNKVDNTTVLAEITNSTSVMMTTVAGNKNAIGYISLGSLNNTVKAVKIDGVEATAENVKNGSYKVSRPFNIVTTDNITTLAQDFINYILSAEGQAIIETEGYVSVDGSSTFATSGEAGKIVIVGSSSVTPVMEKLAEKYQKINTNATIEIQQNDSTTGVTAVTDGICDIGMASRELKDSEIKNGAKSTVIAMDGIAIILNNENTVDNLSAQTIKDIYTATISNWDEIK